MSDVAIIDNEMLGYESLHGLRGYSVNYELETTKEIQLTHGKRLELSEINSIVWKAGRFPVEVRKSVLNLLLCDKRDVMFRCVNRDCEHEEWGREYCHDRFCKVPNCIAYRIKNAERKLEKFDIRSEKLYHFTIGSNCMDKGELELCIRKWVKKMRGCSYRDKNYKFRNLAFVKVFDISNKYYDSTGKLFYHFHFAAFGDRIKDVREFILLARTRLKMVASNAVFNNIGWRRKVKLFNYFSKRIAGVFGHVATGYYYLPELMSMEEYFEDWHNSKWLTWSFGSVLVNIISACSRTHECPMCGDSMRKYNHVLHDSVFKPPDG